MNGAPRAWRESAAPSTGGAMLGLALANSFFVLFSLGSVMPFLSASELSQATFNALIGWATGAMVVLWLTGRWWNATPRRGAMASLVGVAGVLACNWLLVGTVLGFTDYATYPAFMQWGLVLTQAFYVPLAYVVAQLALAFLLTPQFVSRARDPGGNLAWTPVAFFAALAAQFLVFWLEGITGTLLLQQFTTGLVAVYAVSKLKRRGQPIEAATTGAVAGGGGSTAAGSRSFLRKVVGGPEARPFLVTVLFSPLILLANTLVVGVHVPEMNFTPVFLQWLCMVVACALGWTVFVRLTGSRSAVLVGVAVVTLVTFVVAASRASAIRDERDLLLWTTAAAVAGVWVHSFLQAPKFATSPLVSSTWGTFLPMVLGIATFYGLVGDIYDPYDSLFWQVGFWVTLVVLCVALLDGCLDAGGQGPERAVGSRAPRHGSSGPKAGSGRKGDAGSGMGARMGPSAGAGAGRAPWRAALLIGLVAFGFAVPPLVAASTFNNASTFTRVLGTPNGGDYYLWATDTMNKVDPHRTPALDRLPVIPSVRVSGARGEHEGTQVVFTPWNVRDLNVWEFEPTGDLVNEDDP
ncbi:MAG: hypothetical protein ACTSU5_15050, partial [Promethearchaeota archaeon]